MNFNVILSQNLVLHLQLIGSNSGSWNKQRKLGFHCLIFSGIVVVLNNPYMLWSFLVEGIVVKQLAKRHFMHFISQF